MQLCMKIALGQGKSTGMALFKKTKNDDHPTNLAREFIHKSKKTNKPFDGSAVIKLKMELERLHLKGTRDFHMAWSGSWTSLKS